jgi:hypothetical protein
VTVVDVAGRIVLERRVSDPGPRERLDLEGLRPGVYLVRVNVGEPSTLKLVVQR